MKDNSLPRIMLRLIKGADIHTSVNLVHLIGFTEAEFQGVMTLGINETYSKGGSHKAVTCKFQKCIIIPV